MQNASSEHLFLSYSASESTRRVVREVALELMNYFFKSTFSRSKWQKMPPATAGCYELTKDASGAPTTRTWRSVPFAIGDLERELNRGRFDHKTLQLFAPQSQWLDEGIDFSTNMHVADEAGDTLQVRLPLTGLGVGFPVVPNLDREGWVVSSFQRVSHSRILRLHRAIVENSHSFTQIEWLDDLRAYVCECVSLIDMMLHQLYLKAEHAPQPGWRFDASILGVRHGRRIVDKLRWVGQITGKPLDNAKAELRAFNEMRMVRNHVQHFDPPGFACSLEGDVVRWLDACSEIARLAWKIRQRVGAPLTEELVALVLLPPVRFVPLYAAARRAAIDESSGYASSCWPELPNSES